MGEHGPVYFYVTGDEEYLPRAPIPPNARPSAHPSRVKLKTSSEIYDANINRESWAPGNVYAYPTFSALPVTRDTCQCRAFQKYFGVIFFLIGLMFLLELVITSSNPSI